MNTCMLTELLYHLTLFRKYLRHIVDKVLFTRFLCFLLFWINMALQNQVITELFMTLSKKIWWTMNCLLQENMMNHGPSAAINYDEPLTVCCNKIWWTMDRLLQENTMNHWPSATIKYDELWTVFCNKLWRTMNRLLQFFFYILPRSESNHCLFK